MEAWDGGCRPGAGEGCRQKPGVGRGRPCWETGWGGGVRGPGAPGPQRPAGEGVAKGQEGAPCPEDTVRDGAGEGGAGGSGQLPNTREPKADAPLSGQRLQSPGWTSG